MNWHWSRAGKQLSKVVWSEGMYLSPLHFQTQSAYFQGLVEFSTRALWFEPFGFVDCKLDADALANGTISIIHARGIFEDGTPFQIPDFEETATLDRKIAAAFREKRSQLTAYLAIPKLNSAGVNYALNGEDSPARFQTLSRPVVDENTGSDEDVVKVGRSNLKILVEGENLADYITLPLCRVIRDGTGQYLFDERFIPPCTQITASERLMTILRRLLDVLADKSESIASRSGRDLSRGMSDAQVSSFWFVHALNSALAPLRHICFSQHGHPELLYRELLRLAGALCTFGLRTNPAELPLYQHLNLEDCFEQIDKHIREHLDLLDPPNCISIPLRSDTKYFLKGAVKDSRCLGPSRWILSIRSPMGEADLIRAAGRLVKICSARFVAELVKRAVAGIPLTHLPVPPAAVSPGATSQYFSLARTGPSWEDVLETKEVGVYVPAEIPNAEIELLVILD